MESMVIKRLWSILLLLTFSLVLVAQNVVTGKVLDAASRQPLDFVNVTLTPVGENTPVTGGATDEDGMFLLNDLADGKYTLTVSFMGYDNLTRVVTLSGKEINLGKLYLKENTQALQEVEVVAQGSQMRFELDKKVFTVDQSIAAAGGSVTDALENIPSVDVDQEGNISLRNSEAVEIWINGKPAGLTSENRAQILEQMPAGSIKEIEVITNPSAKYSPEGTAGIINLVMKKDRDAGYYGSVNLRLNYALAKPWTTPPGGNLGFNINFNHSIVDGYFNAGYNYRTSNGRSVSDRYNFLASDTTRLTKDGGRHHNGGGLFLRAGLNFHVTDRSTIGVSGFGIVESGNDKTNGWFSARSEAPAYYELFDVDDYYGPQKTGNTETLLRAYDRNQKGTGYHPGWNAMIDWHFAINRYHDLKVSAQFFQFGWNQDTYYTQREYQVLSGVKTGNVASEQVQEQMSKNKDRTLQLKADYEWKPTTQSRLEAGWQTDLAWRNTLADAWEGDSKAAQLTAYYNDFHNNEQTHALYITYGNRFWDKFSVQVGLRGEYFKRHISSAYYDALTGVLTTASQDTSYFQLFPSVYLSYSFDNGHELQVNYTRRIDRPRGHQINPRQDFSDSTNIQYGNPNLLPQYSSAVELNYLKLWERHTLSAGLFYRYADDVTQNIKYMDASIMRNTFINLGKRHEAGVELTAKNKFFGEVMNMTTTFNFYYNRLDKAAYTPVLNGVAKPEVVIPEQNIFAWSARINIGLMFTKTFTGQITASYRSPRVMAQGQTSHSYTIDLSLRKTFLDRKLALAFNVRDLLNSRARRNTSESASFWQYSENQWNSRQISLSLTYNFGNTKKNKPDRQGMDSSMDMNSYEDTGSDY